MAKKHKRKAQPKRQLDWIQIAAIAVALLVVGWFAWKYIPRSEPVVAVPEDGSSPCYLFSSIPAAEQYDAPPPMMIDEAGEYFAIVKMEKGGEFAIQLYPDKAPVTVNSFIFLSCKGYFDGLTFHRVIEGFMAQGGDPTGTGMGGPGYEFQNEDSDLRFDKEGVVAMANAGRDTNGSQFFVTFGPTPHLNGGYTIFGQVIEGMDVVKSITLRDPQQNPSYEGDVIESVTIIEG